MIRAMDTGEQCLVEILCTIVTFLFLFGSPDIDRQFAFSGDLSQSLLLLLILNVLFGFVTK